ncbi:MAG: hypothetical protein COA96_16830 [SAR86 cluster bacterium]|uniref:Uncharacterized protein n=1 Tax=SAR86 cluster bacterium TaxID=2030880 RepID=A0A2A5AG64_9GAMM|nr:MAG: hypothetical protein COA96_16830 [SAR86 cluster bacterium]
MRAIVKHTLPKLGGLYETGETVVRDSDPKYRAWVDSYNDDRELGMNEKVWAVCKSSNLPIRYGYNNPLMMLQYLSPGTGICFSIALIIHSVEIVTD